MTGHEGRAPPSRFQSWAGEHAPEGARLGGNRLFRRFFPCGTHGCYGRLTSIERCCRCLCLPSILPKGWLRVQRAGLSTDRTSGGRPGCFRELGTLKARQRGLSSSISPPRGGWGGVCQARRRGASRAESRAEARAMPVARDSCPLLAGWVRFAGIGPRKACSQPSPAAGSPVAFAARVFPCVS